MKRFVLSSSIASTAALALSCLVVPQPAAAQSGETGNVCVRDYRSGAVCTANDVRIEQLVVSEVVEDCTEGTVGEAIIVFEMLVSAEGSPNRYDIGAFLALDGGSALSGDNCYHDFLNPPLTTTPTFGDQNNDLIDDIYNGPWSNLEPGDASDTCGDIQGGTQVIKTLEPLTVACVDSNFDGSVDVSVCASWDNNTNGTCTGITGAFPGTNSKCGCGLLELGIDLPGPVGEPAIAVSKNPTDQAVLAGDDAVFEILVSNAGDEDLFDVVVTDLECDTLVLQTGDVGNDGILGTGETWTYECTVENVTEDFTNLVEVTADNGEGTDVSDSDTALVTVISPSISVEKDPPTQDVVVGGNALFTILVENIGNVDLTNVVVIDLTCTSLEGPFGDDGDDILGTGETWSYTCTVANVLDDFVNVAEVTATPPLGDDVSDSATAAVTVVEPAQGIPTLSGWAISILATLMAGVGVLLILRARSSG
jgi:uncharacterized repeat protein (TIGR01451 family)